MGLYPTAHTPARHVMNKPGYSMPVDLVAQIYGGPLKFGLPTVVAARSAKVPCTVITHALSSSITWLGERKDIRCILAATDVFTLPTFYREGIPRVLLEAASTSLPLVATQRRGCEDVIPEGTNGFLVPARDSAALAEAILKLVRDSHLRERFARESRRIAVTRFDLQGIARRTARLYEGLLRKRVRMDLSGRVHPAVREDANDSEYPSVRARSGREQQRDKHSRATTTPVQPG